MPDGVVVGELLPGEKDDAEGVGESSCDKEPKAGRGEFLDNGWKDGDDEPAHDDIEGGGGPVLAVAAHKSLGEDAADSEKPDDAEDGPAKRSANGDEGEGGIGAGDQEIDGRVVKDLEELFDFVAREAVVKRGREVEHDHAGSKDDS